MIEELVKIAQAGGPVAVALGVVLLTKACERLARIEKALDLYMKQIAKEETEKDGNHEA